MRYYSNLASITAIANSTGLTTTGTALTLVSVVGMPTSFPFTLRLDPNTSLEEIVTVVSGVGTAGTPYVILRGQDNTTAKIHVSGAVVSHGLSARDLQEPQNHMVAAAPVSGLGPHDLPVAAWSTSFKTTVTTTTPVANVIISSIPTTLKSLHIEWRARTTASGPSDYILFWANEMSGVGYYASHFFYSASAQASATGEFLNYWSTGAAGNSALKNYFGTASVYLGQVPGAFPPGEVYGVGSMDVIGWDKNYPGLLTSSYSFGGTGATRDSVLMQGGGRILFAGPYQSIRFLANGSNFATGCTFSVEGRN